MLDNVQQLQESTRLPYYFYMRWNWWCLCTCSRLLSTRIIECLKGSGGINRSVADVSLSILISSLANDEHDLHTHGNMTSLTRKHLYLFEDKTKSTLFCWPRVPNLYMYSHSKPRFMILPIIDEQFWWLQIRITTPIMSVWKAVYAKVVVNQHNLPNLRIMSFSLVVCECLWLWLMVGRSSKLQPSLI